MKQLVGAFASLLLLSGTSVLTACNTMEGAGKDVEKAGETIQKCADRTDPSCKQ